MSIQLNYRSKKSNTLKSNRIIKKWLIIKQLTILFPLWKLEQHIYIISFYNAACVIIDNCIVYRFDILSYFYCNTRKKTRNANESFTLRLVYVKKNEGVCSTAPDTALLEISGTILNIVIAYVNILSNLWYVILYFYVFLQKFYSTPIQ